MRYVHEGWIRLGKDASGIRQRGVGEGVECVERKFLVTQEGVNSFGKEKGTQ